MSRAMELARELLAELEKESGCTCGDECTCESKEKGVQLSELILGEVFSVPEIGEMKVLEHFEDGTTAVIQNDFYEEDLEFDRSSCDYTKSDLRRKFDGEIAEAYENVFGDNLVKHEVDLKSVDMQDYGKFECKVRPITFDEARKYNVFLVKKELPDWWWTCTPWSTKERGWGSSVAVVSPSGCINFNFCLNGIGVRPFCILKSNIFVSKED